MKACRVRRGIAVLILNLSIKWRWVVRLNLLATFPHYPWVGGSVACRPDLYVLESRNIVLIRVLPIIQVPDRLNARIMFHVHVSHFSMGLNDESSINFWNVRISLHFHSAWSLKLMYIAYVWLVNAESYTDVLSLPSQICLLLEIERNIAHSGTKVF